MNPIGSDEISSNQSTATMIGLSFALILLLLILLFSEVHQSRREVSKLRQDTNQRLSSLQEMIFPEQAPEQAEPEIIVPEPEPMPMETFEPEPETIAEPPPLPIRQAAMTPEPAPVVEREPNKFETSVKTIMKRIWNWIVVGEEHRPAGVTMEFAIATTWLLRIGLVILVLGIGFFLQYSGADHLMGPPTRVAIGIISGIFLLFTGIALHRGKYQLMGHGFCGGAIAVLYTSFLVSHSLAGLAALAAFGLMALVTVVAGILAVRLNSLLVAFLGLIGGYGTPVLLGPDTGSTTILFSYLVLLGLGVFWIASKKDWRILYYSAFLATYSLFGLQLGDYLPSSFLIYMPFLVGFFILFSTVTFIHQVISEEKSTLLEILFLFLNAAVFFGFAWHIMTLTYQKEALAIITLSLAAFYIIHIYIFLARKLLDRPLLLSFIGLATVFVAITLPVLLTEGWVTVGWAIQGFVMLWIASKLRSEFLKLLAYALYTIVIGRLLFFETGHQFFEGRPEVSIGALLQRLSLFGIPVLSLFAAHRLLQIPGRSVDGLTVDRDNDISAGIPARIGSVILFWSCVAVGFLYLNFELYYSIGHIQEVFTLPSLTLLWIGLAVVAFCNWQSNRSPWVFALFTLISGLILAKLIGFDRMMFAVQGRLADTTFGTGFAPRFVDFAGVLIFFTVMWHLFGRAENTNRARLVFGYTSIALAFFYSTMELVVYSKEYWPQFANGSLSIYWALFGLTLLLFGILKKARSLRGIGLILLSIVVAKVFFHDLTAFEPVYRILAFIALGIIVLIGSFLYLRFQSNFELAESK